MDYRDTARYGHFKYFWELGRFHHLITLAKAYYLTREEKYAIEVAKQIKGFVEQCPYLLGVQWTMPMELGIRLISLVWITAFMSEYLREDSATCRLIQQIARSHVEYTVENFSRFSSANNHLIGELTGVFLASLCFEGLGRMTRYKQQSYGMLCEEIARQFYSDGVNKEQTTHYHISCWNCFLLAGLLGRANKMDFPAEYWKTLEKGAEFICAMSSSDCSIAQIGDSDDGRTIFLTETGYNQVQSLLATAAVLFKRPDFKAKAGVFDEMSFWLLGREGRSVFDSLPTDDVAPDRSVFPDGGYYIMKSCGPANVKLVFDCGPLGFGAIAGHGHADALSFTLRAYGREFIIDPGTYTYEAENPYRNYFRSTAAHNTITVDGKNQSEMAGPFLWSHKANSYLEEWTDEEDFAKVAGWHDGYQRLSDSLVHKREILLDKRNAETTIVDTIKATSIHKISQFFHFAPECEVKQSEANCFDIVNGGYAMRMVIDERFTCQVFRGSESPICGWTSRSYDEKVPSYTLKCVLPTQGEQRIRTKISFPCKDHN